MNEARTTPGTVFVVDDHAGVRHALREMILATPGLVLVGEASSGREAVRAVAFLRPDLVLLDVRMPGLDGFAAASIMIARHPDLCVILHSADPIQPPADFRMNHGQVALMCKQELSPRIVLDVWHASRRG